jgi:hypothetical protein
MKEIRKRRCKHCKEYFIPDYRNNAKRQRYCGKAECRKASKKASQQKWLGKPENKEYFRGSTNVERVQEWRKANPDYRQRKKNALQEDLSENTHKNQQDKIDLSAGSMPYLGALQDIWNIQYPVIIGLIANLTGSVLQEDVEKTVRRMQNIGIDILKGSILNKGGQNDIQTGNLSGTNPQSSQTIQLDRPSPGP